MSNSIPKELSPFGQSALKLDGDFLELGRLSEQLERLEIDCDSGLERAKQLLAKFTECGARISEAMQTFAKALEAARDGAEKAAESVSIRATLVQKRQEQCDLLTGKFQILGESVRKVTAVLAQFKKSPGGELSVDERVLLVKQLPELDSSLGALTEEASQLRKAAHEAHMKSLEQNAESLGQSLNSARQKLGALAAHTSH